MNGQAWCIRSVSNPSIFEEGPTIDCATGGLRFKLRGPVGESSKVVMHCENQTDDTTFDVDFCITCTATNISLKP